MHFDVSFNIKEDYKTKPDYKEDLEEIFELWQIF